MTLTSRKIGTSIALAVAAVLMTTAAAQDSVRARDNVSDPPLHEAQRGSQGATHTNIKIDLPDLRPTRIKAKAIFGGDPRELEVFVDVVNEGKVSSKATEMLVTVAVINPHTGQRVYPPDSNTAQSQYFRTPLAVLAPGESKRFYGGLPVLPNSGQDWDLGIEVTVDAPAGRVNGHVPESNEANNRLYRTCRVHGPNPNMVGPLACDR